MRSVQQDILEKLSSKEDEILSYKSQINKINKNKNTIPFEKYEKILDQLNEEQNAHLVLYKNFELLKRENEVIKQSLLEKTKELAFQNNDNHNMSLIDKNQSKFIEDLGEINEFFLEVSYIIC